MGWRLKLNKDPPISGYCAMPCCFIMDWLFNLFKHWKQLNTVEQCVDEQFSMIFVKMSSCVIACEINVSSSDVFTHNNSTLELTKDMALYLMISSMLIFTDRWRFVGSHTASPESSSGNLDQENG